MCGIAGIVMNDPLARVETERLARMRDVLAHRGPDGEGLVADGPAGLAHRRLAIIDPQGGRQPLSDETGAVWLACNGEIYNHAGLRRELEEKGHRFRTASDNEVIVHLYEEHEDRCVERLRGMFAFALWDRRRSRLLLARDRLGIKPLYYAEGQDALLFGSEIKSILASGSITAAFDESVLPEYLATRFVSGEETFYRGIRKLLPGHLLTWTPGGPARPRRYWTIPDPQEGEGTTLEEAARGLRLRLEEVVRAHLMSDVPVGLFLSGGLDSSGLALLMAGAGAGTFPTFSVGFDDQETSELAYARLAAQAARSEHRHVTVRPEQFFAILPRLVWHEDEPIAFTSSVPLYFVSRLAAAHVKVVLTGEGADELFLGYNRYRVTAWNERLAETYWRLVPSTLRGSTGRLIHGLPRGLRRYAERTFLAHDPGPRDLFCENFAVFPSFVQRHLLRHPELADEHDPHAGVLRAYQAARGDPLDRMSRADLQTYLVELLMKQDQMSMAASIESRVPYLDHELVEYAAALPARFKLRGWRTKAVLRAALRDLVPRPILTRRKMGFPVPLGRWLRERHWEVVREFVLSPRAANRGLFEPAFVRALAHEHRNGTSDHGDRLWLLVNLEIWQRLAIDGDPIESIRAGGHA